MTWVLLEACFKCKKVATSSVVWVFDEPRPYASCKMVINKVTTEGCQLELAENVEHRYPSHARMWVGPIRSGLVDQKKNDYEAAMDDWYGFLEDTKDYYGVDMSVLTRPFSNEQEKYYLQTSLWNNLHPNQVIGTAAVIKEIDCLTASVNDILEVKSSFSSAISMAPTRLCGFAGWFDVHFRGRGEDPAQKEIELTTAPSSNNGTHWGQQIFMLHPPVHVDEDISLDVSFSMNRSKENHRLMEVEFDVKISKPSGKILPPINKKFYIE
ncbi:protein arginine N-methyltransferase PRMT10-like [Gossypium australe]|uniref:Protein arginine N-methyltransferase PRMT10-like n=1 Tax=Gossypium australe TaxID=47621 RepID=A0A5B6XA32_9ROSI|nr:protein arginine N-methyltransferase PRMT10-like [Gossypium australe]